MRSDPRSTTKDPLAAYMAGAFLADDKTPIPIVDTQIAVQMNGGLARVDTTRTFRNAEDKSIEISITFPVPVHAVLFRLEARIGERHLVARAQRRDEALSTYEAAVDSGHSAVLHEEVLKGVHMLSLAHVPPGVEIEVRTAWALPLTVVAGRGTLRIPLTVGDIYGCSPLINGDDLIAGGPQLTGRLTIEGEDKQVWLHGRPLVARELTIPLNRPIDLSVRLWTPLTQRAVAHDGSVFDITLAPAPQVSTPLRLAVMVDRSGSMDEVATLVPGRRSKHQVVKLALGVMARQLFAGDQLAIWEFDDEATRIGVVRERKNETPDLGVIAGLNDPRGGTEIGRALQTVLGKERASDILLITDGKSHALDVQVLARHRRRISVLLVGEDSLETNIGHLAAQTGGDIFVAAGENIAQALQATLASLRLVPGLSKPGEVHRSGVTVTYKRVRDTRAEPGPMNDALIALAVSLELKDISESEAAILAALHGLVTHLTSLVLVEEGGSIQGGQPERRKVALPSPATGVMHNRSSSWDFISSRDLRLPMMLGPAAPAVPAGERTVATHANLLDWSVDPDSVANGDPSTPLDDLSTKLVEGTFGNYSALVGRIDWNTDPERLRNGDLAGVEASQLHLIGQAAAEAAVVYLAALFGISPIQLVIALIAWADCQSDESEESGVPGEIALSLLPDDWAHVEAWIHLGVCLGIHD